MDNLVDLVELIVKNIVEKPDEVKVSVLKTTKNISIQIESNESDHGRIIGKSGKTINAIKTLVSAIKFNTSEKDNRKIDVELIEEEDFLSKNRR